MALVLAVLLARALTPPIGGFGGVYTGLALKRR
jgi:hypothetical protein